MGHRATETDKERERDRQTETETETDRQTVREDLNCFPQD